MSIAKQLCDGRSVTPTLGALSLAEHADSNYVGEKIQSADDHRTMLLPAVLGQPRVAWLQDQASAKRIYIDRFPYIIGRSDKCDLIFRGAGVSRRHAIISRVEAGFIAEDASSLNGLRVNGHRVQRVLLGDDDRIEIGEVTLCFGTSSMSTKPSSAASAKPESLTTTLNERKGGVRYWVAGMLAVAAAGASVVGYEFYHGQQVKIAETTAIVEPGQEFVRPSKLAIELFSSAVPNVATPVRAASMPFGRSKGTADVTPVNVKSSQQSGVTARHHSRLTAGVSRKPKRTRTLQRDVARIEHARSVYLQGHAPQALVALREIANQTDIDEARRAQARELAHGIEKIYADYLEGQHAFKNGEKEIGFSAWLRYLNSEQALLSGARSVYAQDVMRTVAAEYLTRATAAAREGRLQDAYRNWARAAAIDAHSTAIVSLQAADAQARMIFREGYRLETIDLGEARKQWRRVLELVGPSSPYYIKASSKLRWYAYLDKR